MQGDRASMRPESVTKQHDYMITRLFDSDSHSDTRTKISTNRREIPAMRPSMRIALLLLFTVSGLFSQPPTQPLADTTTVVIIPVRGDVDPAMAAFIKRALRDHAATKNPLFVLEMDTFGGRVDAALEIVDTLIALTPGRTIAFVKNKAISAGALIALACSKLAMSPHTTIGDCAPIAYSGEGAPTMLGEKFQSPLRAKFRALARRNNYPTSLCESMVSSDMTIYKVTLPDTTLFIDSLEFSALATNKKQKIVSKSVILSRGELLTMDDNEAREYGFSSTTAGSIDSMLVKLAITPREIIWMERNWSEQFVAFITMISPILMILGFAALYTEIRTPGFGAPGIVGIICLGLVFAGQYLVGLADYTDILLLAVGLVLLGIEIFVIPGFGVVGILGIFIIAVSITLSLQGFVVPSPELPWQQELLTKNIFMVMTTIFGSALTVILFFWLLFPRLGKLVAGPYLTATLSGIAAPDNGPSTIRVGDTGVVAKPLRPSGKAQFNETMYDVITEGEFIENGTPVVITLIEGMRIVVTRHNPVATKEQ